MVDKKLLRQLKGKIKTTKKFRDKIKELGRFLIFLERNETEKESNFL